MRVTETSRREVRADGVVIRVDTVNRELTVQFSNGPRVIDVPPDCPITLRGERVRLRMVQARDPVGVTFSDHRNSRVASAVEVLTGSIAIEPVTRLHSAKSSVPTR